MTTNNQPTVNEQAAIDRVERLIKDLSIAKRVNPAIAQRLIEAIKENIE